MSEAFVRIESIFRKTFKSPSLILHPEMTSFDVPGWDSLNNIALIISIEKELRVKFSAAEVVGLQNVGEMVKLVEKKLSDL